MPKVFCGEASNYGEEQEAASEEVVGSPESPTVESILSTVFLLTMLDRTSIVASLNKVSTEGCSAIVRALVEGCSVRSVVRVTGASKSRVTKLLVELGQACSAFQDEALRHIPCKRLLSS